MTFISRGEVYDGPLTDCDLDALIDARLVICMHRSNWPTSVASLFTDAFAAAAGLFPDLPAAAGLDGAGSPVPVSGLATAPGTPNETRNE
jgi:hypothetical protein